MSVIFPATGGVSNRNTAYDKSFQKNQDDFTYPTNYSRMNQQFANPTFMKKLQYYDSPVQNSHMYPNMFHIQPVEFNEKQSDVGMFLFDSIEKKKKFLYGGHLIDVKRIDRWG